jgi:hypothetical protein
MKHEKDSPEAVFVFTRNPDGVQLLTEKIV